MTKLYEIERDIAALSPEELARMRERFEQHDADAFDRQIESDAATGRLNRLIEGALADQRAGRSRPL